MSQKSANLTCRFGSEGLGMAEHGLVQSDPVRRGSSQRFICRFGSVGLGMTYHGLVQSHPVQRGSAHASSANLRQPHIFKCRMYGKKHRHAFE